LGGGSNVLVDGRGFDGVVVDLSQGLRTLCRAGPDEKCEYVLAQAGVDTRAFAHFCRRSGLTGAEFLGGIPGSIGGAVIMNAGAYGSDMRGILIDARLLDRAGMVHTWPVSRLGLAYRCSGVPTGWTVLSARFCLQRGEPEKIRETMRLLNRKRLVSQPLALPSAGSAFKNPPDGTGTLAWHLIDAAGMRGQRVGDAQVSEKHCNFLVNLGRAQFCDMVSLIDRVRDAVVRTSGVTLALEVKIVDHVTGILGEGGL
jgi:UDP-N-acetylmuramate dehydrogenase